MNGVFGWGLNQKDSIERAFTAVHGVLRRGGLFVLGWNDTPDLVPVPLTQIVALQDFATFYFPPLRGTSFKCSTGAHTYSFYTKTSTRPCDKSTAPCNDSVIPAEAGIQVP
jgi:hypothetical protein